MPAAPKQKLKRRIFHVMLVSGAEEWYVEAESAEEARELLSRGEGRRRRPEVCFTARRKSPGRSKRKDWRRTSGLP